MRLGSTVVLILALNTTVGALADQDEGAEFARRVEGCLESRKNASEPERRDCLQTLAILQIYSEYRRPAQERVFSDFELDHPDWIAATDKTLLIASAKHWKDLDQPGPESREFMLQVMRPGAGMPPTPKVLARLRRSHGESIDMQITRFLEGKFDFDRDLEPLYALKPQDFYAELKKRTPSVETFMASFALDDVRTDATSCPALNGVVERLSEVAIPLPHQVRPRETQRSTTIERIVLHPHVVVLRLPAYPITLTITDASMDTDVYRWIVDSMAQLEPCWRDSGTPPAKAH